MVKSLSVGQIFYIPGKNVREPYAQSVIKKESSTDGRFEIHPLKSRAFHCLGQMLSLKTRTVFSCRAASQVDLLLSILFGRSQNVTAAPQMRPSQNWGRKRLNPNRVVFWALIWALLKSFLSTRCTQKSSLPMNKNDVRNVRILDLHLYHSLGYDSIPQLYDTNFNCLGTIFADNLFMKIRFENM